MATHHVSGVDGAAAEKSAHSWGLLEGFAWIGNVENATTAVSKTSDNKHIQIIFCPPLAPPHLSRFYIHTPDGADMTVEPIIVATEDDIALLRVHRCRGMYTDYYVYQAADDSSGTPPSLTLLPPTPYIKFNTKDMGLLRLPGKQYIVAGFRFIHEDFPEGDLALCVYDSNRGDWKLHDLALSVQGRQVYGNKQLVHKNCKVLTIGGDAGTMAFVDLWRGVLFCDVLTLEREAAAVAHQGEHNEAFPLVGYVKLPDALRRTARIGGDARLYRDMVFLDRERSMATPHVSPGVDGAAAAEKSAHSWGLLEGFAWIGNVENATTAVSKTSDNKHIQITFCPPLAPPHLSRFYIHTPDGADMTVEPIIVATEDDIALLRVQTCVGMYTDYYVYQAADDSSGTPPSLTLLPPTPYIKFNTKDMGLLRLPGKQYIVAGFRFIHEDFPEGDLALCVYDSNRGDWKLHDLALSVQGRQVYGNKQLVHKNCKVLTIGGDAGTMAFVDLWRGVLFCDVLTLEREAAAVAHQGEHNEAFPLVGYVKLPDELRRTARIGGDARLYRDMVFLGNHLKCVDLPTRSLWIRPWPATTGGDWSLRYMIRSFKEVANRNPRVNLLPGHTSVCRSFTGLNIRQPVVGLHDDDARILYFVVKTDLTAAKGSVIALDMSTRKILGVSPFVTRHKFKYDFTYMPTGLFKHLSFRSICD
nr:unnamed protein product [Digitaria exilis]